MGIHTVLCTCRSSVFFLNYRKAYNAVYTGSQTEVSCQGFVGCAMLFLFRPCDTESASGKVLLFLSMRSFTFLL
jgi:hypothetical protein